VGIPTPLASESADQHSATKVTPIHLPPSHPSHAENEVVGTLSSQTTADLMKQDGSEGSDGEVDDGVEELEEFELIVADGVDETLRQESAANVSLDMDAEDNYDEGVVEEDDSDYEDGSYLGLNSDDEYEP
jgi:hypothetical protein